MNTTAMILSHVPSWVWALLAGLIALGLMQARDQWLSAKRLRIVPAVFLALGAWSTVSAFGWRGPVIAAFFIAMGLATRAVRATGWPGQARYDAARALFHLPGSWVPMFLILAIFVVKFGAGMALGLHPSWAGELDFAVPVAALYGALGAIFLARARNVLALRQA